MPEPFVPGGPADPVRQSTDAALAAAEAVYTPLSDKPAAASKKHALAIFTMYAAPLAGIAGLAACVAAVWFGVPLSPDQCLAFAGQCATWTGGAGVVGTIGHTLKDVLQVRAAAE